ncbi:amidase protein [Ophiostoma piceae UAMH 11346]|uniref:amidase n=1 Tax=Ophiostoma piceae (strain UAMH 11346) TaxID=1262450 RepID=S3C359_OPHP1|nr:amidase protein [Ophiostoma piceae UAMH 11346]
MSSFLGLQHKRDCKIKQDRRAQLIRDLPGEYQGPITTADRAIYDAPIQDLVKQVHDDKSKAINILHAYGKAALRVHSKTNCLTEVMISDADKWVHQSVSTEDSQIKLKGPLAGIPVSLKDTIVVGGYDATVGYSSFTNQVQEVDGPMVAILKDAGAVPFVKTNMPITLLSFESTNDVWGRCTNPHNKLYSPGGSTGGESALLAGGGSRIGVGSDVAGSVRLPAHWSGCYSLRCSTGRWPKLGFRTSMPGQEGVPSVYSPMARTLNDLSYFTESLVKMKPWEYDYSVHRLAWDDSVTKAFASADKPLRVGVFMSDGVVDPSPACRRAVEMVSEALIKAGHTVTLVGPGEANPPPSPYEGLRLSSLLLNADGCATFEVARRNGEWLDTGAKQMRFLAQLPSPLRYLYYLWVQYVRGDSVWAGLVRNWGAKSALENWQLVSQREAYRAKWFTWWDSGKFDVLVTPPNATPALPHDAMHDAVSSCGYTFLFNLLDYTAGVMPVTHVDKELDALPKDFSLKELNGVAQGAMKHYDAAAMHGLPVGVQIVGRRLEEEKVLSVMKLVEEALGDDKYELLQVD